MPFQQDERKCNPTFAMMRDSDAKTVGVGLLLLLAFWFGLVTGLLEVTYLARRASHHVFVWHGQQALWMIPLAEGVLFLGAGAGILAARRHRRWNRTRSSCCAAKLDIALRLATA